MSGIVRLFKKHSNETDASREPFSASTTILFTLAWMSVCIGLTAMVGFVGQCTLELPYHLFGKEATATVGNQWDTVDYSHDVPISSTEVTVYYFTEEQPQHLTASRLRGVERLPYHNLRDGSQIQIVYLANNSDEVMPKEVLSNAGHEIGMGVLGGLGIALPGALLLWWLKRSGWLGYISFSSIFGNR
jgi:hypothetical protein